MFLEILFVNFYKFQKKSKKFVIYVSYISQWNVDMDRDEDCMKLIKCGSRWSSVNFKNIMLTD